LKRAAIGWCSILPGFRKTTTADWDAKVINYLGDANAAVTLFSAIVLKALRNIFEGKIAHYVNQAALAQASITAWEDNRQKIVGRLTTA
jgi:hypothetical protein